MEPFPALPPRITIITPCRNGERYIVEAVESLRRQRYPSLEHIVFDACSTDATLSLLRQYPEITVVSEPDAGAHDAMNRGLRRASGDIIGFLNVDDLYPEALLNDVGNFFAANPDIDVLVGGAVMFEDDQAGRRRILSERKHQKQDGLWLPELTFGVPGINGWFFRRRVFERAGEFNNDFYFSGDRLLLMCIRFAGLKSKLLGRPGIYYRSHAGSMSMNREMANLMAITNEHFRMALYLWTRADATAYDRRVFLAWHAFEGTKLVVRYALAGKFRAAVNILFKLCRHNPLWPIRLAHGIALRLGVMRLDRPATEERRAAV